MNAEIDRLAMLVWRRIETRAVRARLGWSRGFPLRKWESTMASCAKHCTQEPLAKLLGSRLGSVLRFSG